MNVSRHVCGTRTITIGFTMMFVCFPLTEWDNWKFHRLWHGRGWCVGPMRFSFRRETTER